MTRFARMFLAAAFAASLAACAMFENKNETASAPISGVVQEDQITTTATVQKIDLKTREVTLLGASGKPFMFKAGEEVRNLPQVKVGDQVTATYRESLAYEVHKPGSLEAGTRTAVGAARAKPGEKPAGVAASVVQITATVAEIDKATPSVTLKRADGELIPIRVRDPKRLEGVAVGDMVEITYTEAVAIAVQPAAAK